MTANAPQRRVEPYVFTLAALSGLAAAGAYAYLVQPSTGWGPPMVALFATCAAGNFLLQRRGFVLHWRGQRVISTIDEPSVYLALAVLPPPAAVLVVFVGTSLTQIVARRRPVKGMFNIAAYTLAALCATVAAEALIRSGIPAPVAALPAILVYTLSSNLMVAGIFARLEGERTWKVFRQRFLTTTPVHSVVGAAFGFASLALWSYHPLAVVVLAPMTFLALGFAKLDASAEREIRVRRRLQQMDAELVGASQEEKVAEHVLAACQDMFVSGYVEITLRDREGSSSTWTREHEGGPGHGRPLVSTIPGLAGEPVGEIAVYPSARVKELLGEADKPLLDIVASRAGTAVESARATRDLLVLKDLHEEIVQGAPAGVLRLDGSGRILQTNAFLLRVFGEAAPPQARESVFEWAPMQRVPEFYSAVREMLQGREFYDFELKLQDARGTTLEAAGVPLADGGVILFSDVTSHRVAQEAMRSQTLTRPFVRRLVLSLVGGLNVPRSAISSVGRSLAREMALTSVEDFAGAFRAMGLGHLQFDRMEGDKYFFSADDLLEKRAGASQPTCHLALGFLEGAVASAHNASSLGTELRCQSQGRARCVFVVQARPEAPVAKVSVPRKNVVRP